MIRLAKLSYLLPLKLYVQVLEIANMITSK